MNIPIDFLEFHNIHHICVDSIGIAASLLKNGGSVHTTLKLSPNIIDKSICNIKADSEDGQIMEDVQIIIRDGISMTLKHSFETMNRLLSDISNVNT